MRRRYELRLTRFSRSLWAMWMAEAPWARPANRLILRRRAGIADLRSRLHRGCPWP